MGVAVWGSICMKWFVVVGGLNLRFKEARGEGPCRREIAVKGLGRVVATQEMCVWLVRFSVYKGGLA